MKELKKALELKNELDGLRPIDSEKEAIIMQKFRLDWNYHSNHLEGNTLTYGETKALLLFNITAEGKPLKDHVEITGHNEAINWVMDLVKGDRPLSENFIRQIHELLLKEPYEVDAITPDGKPTKKKIHIGTYKKTPNHVKTKTGEIFRFATPEETPAKMMDLLQWYTEKIKEKEINPILLAAEFHYRFIRIHPFDDGNGRTARILMNFILMKYGFPPTIIKTEDKENYFVALRLADAGNIEAFIKYIAKNLNYSLALMIVGAKGENIEEEDDIEKEVALLEQRFKYLNQETSSKEAEIKDVKDNYVGKLFKKVEIMQRQLFEKFYDNLDISISESINPKINTISRPMASECTFSLKAGLMKLPFTKSEFYFNLKFIFLSEYYLIDYNGISEKGISQGSLLIKNYDSVLTDQEIEQVVNKTISTHKSYLERIIEEKENSKSK